VTKITKLLIYKLQRALQNDSTFITVPLSAGNYDQLLRILGHTRLINVTEVPQAELQAGAEGRLSCFQQ
jgi:hypothetical protein